MALKVSGYVSIVNSFFLKIILILGTNKSDQKHIILLPHCAAAVCCRQKNCYCSKIHGIEKGRIYQHFFCSFSDLHNAITHHCVHYVFSNTICVSLYCCLLLGCGIYICKEKSKYMVHIFGLQWTCSFYKVFHTSTDSHSVFYANITVVYIYHPKISNNLIISIEFLIVADHWYNCMNNLLATWSLGK